MYIELSWLCFTWVFTSTKSERIMLLLETNEHIAACSKFTPYTDAFRGLEQNRTLWNQINMRFIFISILDFYQHGMQDHHETKSRWTYFYSWIISTWDARSPWDQNKMSIIFGLDLYQHGDARSPWDQNKKNFSCIVCT